MFRKLYLQMTFFCCAVISVILVTMTGFSLKLIKDNQELRQFQDFQKRAAGIYETLSDQDNISHIWLRKISEANSFRISILDQETPILFDPQNTSAYAPAFEYARKNAQESYALSAISVKNSGFLKHVEFQTGRIGSEAYLASVGYIPKQYGILTVTILAPIPSQSSTFKSLFLPIMLAALAAILLLSFCSFLLVRSLIRPLKESHEQQIHFFAAASHELRSPVTVIMTSLPLLKNPSAQKREAAYSLIEKECLRMKRLIHDMFTLASLDNGKIAIHKEHTRIDNLLIESYEKFAQLAAGKDIRIEFLLPDILIPEMDCDPERIAQVFAILLDNAISYTPQGGTIRVSLALQINAARIAVADSGPGIADAYKEKIFHRFFRCDQSRTDKNHFGLGLSIAKEIVELHGGTITAADSQLGGAEFIVTLPFGNVLSG